jgi:hypothetical protein
MATGTITWLGDVEHTLAAAGSDGKLALIEISQAPRCAGCVRLEAEVYPDDRVAKLLGDHFVTARLLRSDHPRESERFNIMWTPTLVMLEPDGTERHRVVGFLPVEDFIAQLELGLAKTAFGRGNFAGAQHAFQAIVDRYPSTDAAPEAVYWAGVSGYKPNRERSFLKQAADTLRQTYPQSDWAKKGSVWL